MFLRLIQTPTNTMITVRKPKATIIVTRFGSVGGGTVTGVAVGRGVRVAGPDFPGATEGVDVLEGTIAGEAVALADGDGWVVTAIIADSWLKPAPPVADFVRIISFCILCVKSLLAIRELVCTPITLE